MDIYLVRHGQTIYNATGRHTGCSDIPMNDTGRQQIRDLAPYLQGISWDKVISSPLGRAKETAAILAPGYEIQEAAWLQEMDFGTWTGLTSKEAEAADPEAWEAYTKDWVHGVAGGAECYQDVFDRVRDGIRQVVAASDKEDKILITAHAVPVLVITMVLLELPEEACWRLIPGQGVYGKLTAYPEENLYFTMEGWNIGPKLGWKNKF